MLTNCDLILITPPTDADASATAIATASLLPVLLLPLVLGLNCTSSMEGPRVVELLRVEGERPLPIFGAKDEGASIKGWGDGAEFEGLTWLGTS